MPPRRHATGLFARAALAGLCLLALPAAGQTVIDSSAGPLRIAPMVEGLDEPWAVGFLPDGAMLITERAGRLWRHDGTATLQEVTGVPEVAAVGQGGLLDILIPRDFVRTRQVYLSYAVDQRGGGQGTALGAGRLSDDGARLEGFERLFEMTPGSSGGRHFGSRIAEGPDGHIFLTIGERGDRPAAQDLARHNGSVIRLARDGSVPADNPFVGVEDARDGIWSYGHRNPQGLALGPDGTLWLHEHGARGGDEINRLRAGVNYGWPVIAYGRHYSGARIGEGTHREGMAQPDYYWDPSIAPSGLAAYSGALWPEWRGDLFAGSLTMDYIARVDTDSLEPGGAVAAPAAEEALEAPETGRVRDVAEGPDGALWFLSETEGALYRITPAR
ncbi:hypothetical protein C2I36_02220 [Rhodobacteraceae bacterium WD3A24]|nr:hypothetical protein C2I36_02220 [Rhodobacteraceae bacterium WD3A24]